MYSWPEIRPHCAPGTHAQTLSLSPYQKHTHLNPQPHLTEGAHTPKPLASLHTRNTHLSPTLGVHTHTLRPSVMSLHTRTTTSIPRASLHMKNTYSQIIYLLSIPGINMTRPWVFWIYSYEPQDSWDGSFLPINVI